ncbi:MAG: hypothetical protein QOI96_163 [Verrucomicrobiota bacterium]
MTLSQIIEALLFSAQKPLSIFVMSSEVETSLTVLLQWP